ncbi:MAG: hypothetical protein BGO91_11310 [Leifsonia sp. 71-9]|nr:MAG: hypothetical protein BGO91_11310 [Leifsonia sp. 71-9]
MIVTEPELYVHWTRRDHEVAAPCHAQVSLTLDRADLLRIAAEVDADQAITRRGVFTGSLGRAELNHLIRTLKRARDAAYGRTSRWPSKSENSRSASTSTLWGLWRKASAKR